MPTLRNIVVAFSLTFGFLLGSSAAQAQCTLPYQLTNGQVADASQVMANYNALITCLAAGGSANAVQINNGSGGLAGVGPLSDGQVVIGSTGNAPQAATLTAGAGVAITNGPGSVTIEATGGGGGSSWQVVTANTTAVQGGMYLADTSAGPFTITLPTSGVVEIRDAKGTFGTSNLTIAAANGQTLSGLTYSGAATIALNAPGNNATVLCGSSVSYVQQVTSGVWGQVSASGVQNIQLTNLPPYMDFRSQLTQVSSSMSSAPYVNVGYGSPPTYPSSSVCYQIVGVNGYGGCGNTGAQFHRDNQVDVNSTYSFEYESSDGVSGALTRGYTGWNYGSGFLSAAATSTGPIAFLFAYRSGTISAHILTFWSKRNI